MKPARELPYAAFVRHLTPVSPPIDGNEPKPIDPIQRITAETIARLAAIEEALAQAQIDVMAQLPEAVRLKLAKLLLTASERAELARSTFQTYAAHGSLTPPRGARPRKKPRFKP